MGKVLLTEKQWGDEQARAPHSKASFFLYYLWWEVGILHQSVWLVSPVGFFLTTLYSFGWDLGSDDKSWQSWTQANRASWQKTICELFEKKAESRMMPQLPQSMHLATKIQLQSILRWYPLHMKPRRPHLVSTAMVSCKSPDKNRKLTF